MAGELEGEDLPLWDFELRYKGGLVYSLLHPSAPPAHKLDAGQHKLVRLGFERQLDAQEYYSLLALALGKVPVDHPSVPAAVSKKVKAASA